MLRLEVRLVVIIATVALFIVLVIEYTINNGTRKSLSTSVDKEYDYQVAEQNIQKVGRTGYST